MAELGAHHTTRSWHLIKLTIVSSHDREGRHIKITQVSPKPITDVCSGQDPIKGTSYIWLLSWTECIPPRIHILKS